MAINWSSLWKKEDWWSVWLGFLILALASLRIILWLPKIGKWTVNPITAFPFSDTPSFIYFILFGFALLILTSLPMPAMKEKIRGYWAFVVFLVDSVVDVILSLITAYIFFSGVFFPSPV